MKINIRHHTLIISALLSIIFVIVGYLFIYRQTINQAEHYLSASKEVEIEKEKKQNEQNLLKIFDETKITRSKISSFFVEKDRAIDFIEMIEKVGTDSLTNIELSAISKDEVKIKAKVTASGLWSGIMSALVLLENLPSSTVMDKVRISVSEDAEKKSKKWTLTLDIETLII